MRKKIFDVLNTIYGVLMTVSFFGGILPLFPFIFALIIGGPVAESISVFIYEKYYPWIIITGSVAILSGLIAIYGGKLEGLSIKSVNTNKSSDKN